MAFTDDDLKRLKNMMVMNLTENEIKALLARLEAAEQVIKTLCEDQLAIDVWRKAAGK